MPKAKAKPDAAAKWKQCGRIKTLDTPFGQYSVEQRTPRSCFAVYFARKTPISMGGRLGCKRLISPGHPDEQSAVAHADRAAELLVESMKVAA